MIASVVLPVESERLPGGVDRLLGAAPALAQAITTGTPDACPTNPQPWTGTGAECVLETDACPESPINGGTALTPSIGQAPERDRFGNLIDLYPGFCEERHDERVDDVSYNRCLTVRGFVVKKVEMEEVPDPLDPTIFVIKHTCRLIVTPHCFTGLHRASSNVCRAVKRRSWTCPTGYIPLNDYNSCYRAPPPSLVLGGTHPGCQQGSPDFVAQDCEDYVLEDYARSPATVLCTSFNTGGASTAMSANTLTGSSSDYWCDFDESDLKVVCHAIPPPTTGCSTQTARCLKRASQTGGCDAIAGAIVCRSHQAAYVAGTMTEIQVRSRGCEPCVVLPFQPVPSSCPRDLRRRPSSPGGSSIVKLESLHRVRRSYATDRYSCDPVLNGAKLTDHPTCAAEPVCGGMPQGALTWISSHFSHLAIVNSPVVLTIEDIPTNSERHPVVYLHGRSFFGSRFDTYLAYGDRAMGDSVVRLWPDTINHRSRYTKVDDLVSAVGSHGSCLVRVTQRPLSRARVEELRPDVPAQNAEILDLFGPNSLDWWTGLTQAEQRSLTEARGLTFWGDLTTAADRDQELDDRAAALNTEIPCNSGSVIWCRWQPPRSGFFKAIGATAWYSKLNAQARQWHANTRTQHLANLRSFLGNSRNRNRADTKLTNVGLTRAEAGLTSNLRGILPQAAGTGANEWLYTEGAGDHVRCPSADLRVFCAGSSGSGIYAETEPVGIQVYEVRVATRAPNN